MKVLVVGNGGREHTLAWKLLQSQSIEKVYVTPGNGGTATLERCENLPFTVYDFQAIGEFAQQNQIAFVVIGPEVPLAMGMTDYLQHLNLKVFGPNQAGAQIEASKSWAKSLMKEMGIPTAKSAVFMEEELTSALDYLATQPTPVVIKADGLAAGKGVTIAADYGEAQAAIEASFNGLFGPSGECIVIEEFLTGQEVSLLALTDGKTIIPLLPAQDHKAIGAGDTGPNTGGMGAYAPAPIITPELSEKINQEILQPTLQGLQNIGIDYRGVIYAGLMILSTGEIKVLEFNCRFGDPETQAILPLLETPLEELMLACIEQRLGELPPLQWKSGASVCVVIAADGYPGSYQKGDVITGIEQAQTQGAIVFHAGTKLAGESVLTDGGRVLGVTGFGDSFDEAIVNTYNAVQFIHFDGAYYRHDIGYRLNLYQKI